MSDEFSTMVDDWEMRIDSAAFTEAAKVSADYLQLLRDVLGSDAPPKGVDGNVHQIRGVFARALYDYAMLLNDLRGHANGVQPSAIEAAWTLLVNCSARIDFCRAYIQGSIIDGIRKKLDRIFDEFEHRYGPGVYLSPEIVFSYGACNICNSSFLQCSHIEGALYDGVYCRPELQNLEMLSVSVVTRPKDKRCRVWPWNYADNTFTAPLLTLFRVDDFDIC